MSNQKAGMKCGVCASPFDSEMRMSSGGNGLYKICLMCGAVQSEGTVMTQGDVLESIDRAVIEETLERRREILYPGGPGYEVAFYAGGEETLRLDIRSENWALESVEDFLSRLDVEAVRTTPWTWTYTLAGTEHRIALEPKQLTGGGRTSVDFEAQCCAS